MADDGKRLFETLIGEATNGDLTVKLDPQGFVQIDQACEQYKAELKVVRLGVQRIKQHEDWGLGETVADMTSARDLVNHFRGKAAGGPNNAYDVLQEYIDTADQVQAMFKTIRDNYARTDDGFAAELRRIST